MINNGRRIPLAIQRSLHVAEVKHYRAGRKPLILRNKQPSDFDEEHDRMAWRRYELTLFA